MEQLLLDDQEYIAKFGLFNADNYKVEDLTFAKDFSLATREEKRACAKNLLRLITSGWQDGAEEIYDNNILKHTIDVKRDPEMLRVLIDEFELGYETFISQMNTHSYNSNTQKRAEVFIQNCLAVYPFLDPADYNGHIFKIPHNLDGKWQLVDFNVEQIALTPTWFPQSWQVYSYIFKACDNNVAHLVHSGTTYPTGQGEITQQFTNRLPFFSIGRLLHWYGKDNIRAAVNKVKNSGVEKLNQVGASLGGSLVMFCEADESFAKDTFNCSYAFNPAGSMLPTLIGNSHIASEELLVIKQNDDPVSHNIGYWPDHAKVWEVIPNNSKDLPYAEEIEDDPKSGLWTKTKSWFSNSSQAFKMAILKRAAAHMIVGVGVKGGAQIIEKNAADDNKSITRFFRSAAVHLIARPLMFILKDVVGNGVYFALAIVKLPYTIGLTFISSDSPISDEVQNIDNGLISSSSYEELSGLGVRDNVGKPSNEAQQSSLESGSSKISFFSANEKEVSSSMTVKNKAETATISRAIYP